jgi:E3 ubiquitin-protein ligase UBR7
VHSETPSANNKYNQNFRNQFCGCEIEYDPFQQKGTMFQCLGLGTRESGGCGEDWYHPGCLVGLGPKWFEGMKSGKPTANGTAEEGTLPTISEDAERLPDADAENNEEADDDDPPMPPGFPAEEDFDGFLCYKCVDAHPWIKKYAGAPGFLPAVYSRQEDGDKSASTEEVANGSKKRKAEEDAETEGESKRQKSGGEEPSPEVRNGILAETKEEENLDTPSTCNYAALPPAPEGQFSLFFKDSFRNHICRCASCYANLNPHPQLLEEEEVYEPPISEDGASEHGGSTNGSGSLLERGESALRNVDRVRAIEGVMAYNHLKDKLKPFFQQFAESGKAISADDIKDYFAKLRGDEQGIKDAGEAAASSSKKDDGDDGRREQSGY